MLAVFAFGENVEDTGERGFLVGVGFISCAFDEFLLPENLYTRLSRS